MEVSACAAGVASWRCRGMEIGGSGARETCSGPGDVASKEVWRCAASPGTWRCRGMEVWRCAAGV